MIAAVITSIMILAAILFSACLPTTTFIMAQKGPDIDKEDLINNPIGPPLPISMLKSPPVYEVEEKKAPEYNITVQWGVTCDMISECMEQLRYAKCPMNFDIFNMTEYYYCLSGKNDTGLMGYE